MTTRIVHLVDDLSAGGVTRGLDYLVSGEALGHDAMSAILPIRRGRLSAPHIEADLIISHLSICWRNLPLLISLRARYPHLPLVHVEHSYSAGFVRHNVVARRRFENLLRVSYALFNNVIAVSRAQADWLSDRALVRSGALRVISTSVDLAPFLALEPTSGRRAKVIGAIGRFHPQKGFASLIAAFRQAAAPDQCLRLFGDGPAAHALRDAAGGDPRIEFYPFTETPADAYAACDIVAAPSEWEPYGLVALEARAAGRPVLASRTDGLVDQIGEGCVEVVEGGWAAAIAALPDAVHTARIAAARREAIAQNRRFQTEWRRLIAELTTQRVERDATRISLAASHP